MNKMHQVLSAIIIMGALNCVVISIALFSIFSTSKPTERPQPGFPARNHAERPQPLERDEKPIEATGGDPWPECQAVRAWLAANVGEPASIEVVKWEDRKTFRRENMEAVDAHGNPVKLPPGETIAIRVRYRGSNQYGGKSVELRLFNFENGKIAFTQIQPVR